MKKFMGEALEFDVYWYGVVMNSFKELEPAYVEHYKIGYGEEDMEHRSFVCLQQEQKGYVTERKRSLH
ncbi:hypothetical protein GQ457_02G035510 [Hibiscus cannabinus]